MKIQGEVVFSVFYVDTVFSYVFHVYELRFVVQQPENNSRVKDENKGLAAPGGFHAPHLAFGVRLQPLPSASGR